MIVKIKQVNKSDGWFIYDNAEGVAYSRHTDIRSFFHDSMGQDAEENVVGYAEGTDLHHTQGSFFNCNVSPKETNPPPQCGCYVSFCKGCEQFEFWADTEVYLLNDNGKTLERIF